MRPPARRGRASPWGPQPSARRRIRAVRIQAGRRARAVAAEALAPKGAAPLLAARRERLLPFHRERSLGTTCVPVLVLPPGRRQRLQLLPLLRRELGLGLLVRADGGEPAVRAKPLDLPHLGLDLAHIHRIALPQAHEIEPGNALIRGRADGSAPGIHPELLERVYLL